MFYAFCVGQEPEGDGGEFLKGQIGPQCFCGGILGPKCRRSDKEGVLQGILGRWERGQGARERFRGPVWEHGRQDAKLRMER